MSTITRGSGRGIHGYPATIAPCDIQTTTGQHGARASDQDRGEALRIRREWMRLMGMSQEEIDERCAADDEPLDLAEERRNLAATQRLAAVPPSDALRGKAAKY